MSHAFSKEYQCKKCPWSGYKIKSEQIKGRDEWGYGYITFKLSCPICGAGLKE